MQNFQIGSKELQITETEVRWENKVFDTIVTNPTELRFGLAPIEVDMFTIGTNHKIELRNYEDQQLTVSIKSYFGLGRSRRFGLYEQVIDAIWDRFFADYFGEIVQSWEDGETLFVGNFVINSTGLTKKAGLKTTRIDFEDMRLLPRHGHLLINSKKEEGKYMRLNHLEDWNWPVVNEIVERMLGKAT